MSLTGKAKTIRIYICKVNAIEEDLKRFFFSPLFAITKTNTINTASFNRQDQIFLESTLDTDIKQNDDSRYQKKKKPKSAKENQTPVDE